MVTSIASAAIALTGFAATARNAIPAMPAISQARASAQRFLLPSRIRAASPPRAETLVCATDVVIVRSMPKAPRAALSHAACTTDRTILVTTTERRQLRATTAAASRLIAPRTRAVGRHRRDSLVRRNVGTVRTPSERGPTVDRATSAFSAIRTAYPVTVARSVRHP